MNGKYQINDAYSVELRGNAILLFENGNIYKAISILNIEYIDKETDCLILYMLSNTKITLTLKELTEDLFENILEVFSLI